MALTIALSAFNSHLLGLILTNNSTKGLIWA